MKRPSLAAALLLASAGLFASGCMASVWVPVGPPAELVEVEGVAPGPAFIWIEGYWAWHSRWVWQPGHWERRPHAGAVWERGRWDHDARGWRWHRGHWR